MNYWVLEANYCLLEMNYWSLDMGYRVYFGLKQVFCTNYRITYAVLSVFGANYLFWKNVYCPYNKYNALPFRKV